MLLKLLFTRVLRNLNLLRADAVEFIDEMIDLSLNSSFDIDQFDRNLTLKILQFSQILSDAYLSGIDINPDLAKVAKMHMVLHDDGHTGIFCANSLLPINELVRLAEKATVPRTLHPHEGQFKILMTNPPFGSKGKVTDKRILAEFQLGHKWKKEDGGRWVKTNKVLDGQIPEILFIERSLQLLGEGGRMAIVLPDGILNNTSLMYVREFIASKARILAVVSMSVGTFIQAGVNPKTSLLFLQKLSEEKLEELKRKQYPIFMAVVEKIGYDLNSKTPKPMYKRNEKGEILEDENRNPILDTDVPMLMADFNNFKEKHFLGF